MKRASWKQASALPVLQIGAIHERVRQICGVPHVHAELAAPGVHWPFGDMLPFEVGK